MLPPGAGDDGVWDLGGPPDLGPPPDLGGPGPGAGGELPPDEPPADIRPEEARPRPRRVTAAVRRDIAAQLTIPLTIGGQVWRARDPICGGTFCEQVPATVDACVEIICDSAAAVEWFTGPAGGLLKYLRLGAALLPVGQAITAHHIAHTVSIDNEGQAEESDRSAYAA
jgi:hypothetical protein